MSSSSEAQQEKSSSTNETTKPSDQEVHGNMDNGPVIDKDGLAVQPTGGRGKDVAKDTESTAGTTKPSYQDVHGKMDNGPVMDKDGLAVQTTGRDKDDMVAKGKGEEDAVEKTLEDGVGALTVDDTDVPPIPAPSDKKKTLEDEFAEVVEWVRASSMAPTNDEKLLCYGYYKQVTSGDVQGSQPWAVQITARAKWDAWAKNVGMEKKEAMQKYIDEVSRQRKKYGY